MWGLNTSFGIFPPVLTVKIPRLRLRLRPYRGSHGSGASSKNPNREVQRSGLLHNNSSPVASDLSQTATPWKIHSTRDFAICTVKLAVYFSKSSPFHIEMSNWHHVRPVPPTLSFSFPHRQGGDAVLFRFFQQLRPGPNHLAYFQWLDIDDTISLPRRLSDSLVFRNTGPHRHVGASGINKLSYPS